MTTKGSVLVVDDHADSRELLVEYLTIVGFTVMQVDSGADAVTSAEIYRPDVVLMDLSMPGLVDGWEAARMINLRGLRPKPIVIAVTAYDYRPYHDSARHAGCRAVVVKPVDVAALVTVIETLVAHRGASTS